jgi:hypothetical protein
MSSVPYNFSVFILFSLYLVSSDYLCYYCVPALIYKSLMSFLYV